MLVEDIESGADKSTVNAMLNAVGTIGNKLLKVAPQIPKIIADMTKLIDKLG